jgi:beta-aspartyl-peptidase (threonine type)
MASPSPRPADADAPNNPNNNRWSLAIHGGAGVINADDPEWIRAGLEGLRTALKAGADVLNGGGSALDAAEAAVVALEDNPLFNAGKGSVLTRSGKHELEASVMVCEDGVGQQQHHHHADGGDGSGALRCGAAALLTRVKNPIRLARVVMERTPHTFIAGEEAEKLAESELGPEALVESNEWFGTEARRAQWRRWKEREDEQEKQEGAVRPPPRPDDIIQKNQTMGTVGAVALDARGGLAAATSTGGRCGKFDGRIGDTPVCGAGNWADRRVAVSGTGVGESFARRCAAKDLAARVEYGGCGVEEAARAVVFGSLARGDGGVIAVDARGSVAMPFNSPGMWRGVADSSGKFEIGVFEGMEGG